MEKKEKKNIKKRVIFVILFIIICAIYFYVSLRGEYLQEIAINEKYVEVFKTNIIKKLKIFITSFVIIYITTNIMTNITKKGLKKFFNEEKKEMPKLPNKSISFAFAVIGGAILVKLFYEKTLLCFSNAWFAQYDPIFHLDISSYMFILPFIKTLLLSVIIAFVILTIYIVTYYVIVFNVYFKKGINFETLKQNTLLKQLIFNVIIIVSSISLLVLIGVTDILTGSFIQTQDGTSLYGAGIIQITIKTVGYIIFSVFMIAITVISVKKLKKGEYKKAFIKMAFIPTYLFIMFIVMISTEFLYLNHNEYDKEKEYIKYNIKNTKEAYDINVEEITLENKGTITKDDVRKNKSVIENINLLDEETVLANLKEYNTNLGYYDFNRAQVGNYNGELVYVSPREILSNDTRTYNNQTYQYTHGYDVIVSSATKFEKTGLPEYRRSGFNDKDESIQLPEPRIYFGLQTDKLIVTNIKNELEYDYPLTSTTNEYNKYDGKAGINLNFIDRVILGIKEKNPKFAFFTKNTKNSNIIIKRNVIDRAKTILPYILYDQNPYLIISDTGRLVWVLDGYTISDKYPYSQPSTINLSNQKLEKINYIRNSVKVFIDAYDGTMEFYITDSTDPIIMAYWHIYPSIFEKIGTPIPKEYNKHLVYPKYLYDIQSKIIARYHNVQPEVLYRADDVWSIAQGKEKKSNKNINEISSYYTMLKTIDEEPTLGLILPYTINGKQNITSYLVGTDKLKVYRFIGDTASLGTTQLEHLIEEDEQISKELEGLKITGTRLEKKISIIPINEKLLYVEPIYQVLINESQVPLLKKVIVASGDKLSIGDNLKDALRSLLSQDAVNITVEPEDIDYLIRQILEANKNLYESNQSNDWELIGKDIDRLQKLIDKLEVLKKEEDKRILKDNLKQEGKKMIENSMVKEQMTMNTDKEGNK